MESQTFEVVIAKEALTSLSEIYEYGLETFSLNAATIFIEELRDKIKNLSTNYLFNPECRFLLTKSKMYRILIFGSYTVIYRITKTRIEVLNVFHSSRSISTIKSSRSIKI